MHKAGRLNHPQWLLMAVFCIVFSSASKRLIELRSDQRFYHSCTSSQNIGKKLKDGSRDKREFFKTFVQSEKQHADNTIPGFLFFLSAFVSLAFIFLFNSYIRYFRFTRQPVIAVSAVPLYLQHRRLQV